MTVFGDAIDAIFASPDFGVPAVYTPAIGDPASCTAITRKPELGGPLGSIGFELSPPAQDLALVAEVRKSEVAAPARGATLTVNSHDYPVRDVKLINDGLVWLLELGKPT